MHEVSSAHASSGTCITFHEARASASTVGGQAELETMNERPPTGCGERAIDGRVLVREVRLQFQADSGANQPVTSASAAVGSDAVRLGKLEEGRFDAILPCDTRARARALLFWVLLIGFRVDWLARSAANRPIRWAFWRLRLLSVPRHIPTHTLDSLHSRVPVLACTTPHAAPRASHAHTHDYSHRWTRLVRSIAIARAARHSRGSASRHAAATRVGEWPSAASAVYPAPPPLHGESSHGRPRCQAMSSCAPP